MAEKVQLTKEQIVARNKANREKNAVRKTNIALIKELVDKSDKKYQDALKLVMPYAYNIRTPKAGGTVMALQDKFVNFVKDKKQVSEDEIFKTFKIGRKDCGQLIRQHLKRAQADARVWVTFDDKSGIYSLVGTGKATPANWKGFVPAEGVQVAPTLK